jgi:hypothetical protein
MGNIAESGVKHQKSIGQSIYCIHNWIMLDREKLEDTKDLIRKCKSEKDRRKYNGKKKKDKRKTENKRSSDMSATKIEVNSAALEG